MWPTARCRIPGETAQERVLEGLGPTRSGSEGGFPTTEEEPRSIVGGPSSVRLPRSWVPTQPSRPSSSNPAATSDRFARLHASPPCIVASRASGQLQQVRRVQMHRSPTEDCCTICSSPRVPGGGQIADTNRDVNVRHKKNIILKYHPHSPASQYLTPQNLPSRRCAQVSAPRSPQLAHIL